MSVRGGRLLLCAAALLLWSSQAAAVGFGALTLKSYLGQPMEATVPLLLAGSETTDHLDIALASPAEYQQMGLPWQPELERIRVTVTGRASGHPVIGMHSVSPMTAPMLAIVLKAGKPGRATYYKHFQVLLDPPNMPEPQIVPLAEVSGVATDAVVRIDANAAGTVASRAAASQAEVAGDWARASRYGPTRSGDSLSEIAYRLRRDKRFTNQQVMLALYEMNSREFVGGDINRLRSGAWLQVPQGEVVRRYGKAEARQRLSNLLQRSSAVPARAVTRKSASAVERPAPQPSAQASGEELKFTSRIGLAGAGVGEAIADEVVKQLEPVHNELMAGKLRMDGLGEQLSALGRDVGTIKEDVGALKREVAELKARLAAPAPAPESARSELWMIAFFALLTGVLAWFVFRLRRAESDLELPEPMVAVAPKSVESPLAASPVSEADTLINQVEELLGRCDYEQAGQLLERLEEVKPGTLRGLALRTQLHHETGDLAARDQVIQEASDALDRKHWESFCHMLPAHVWNACFGGQGVERGQ